MRSKSVSYSTQTVRQSATLDLSGKPKEDQLSAWVSAEDPAKSLMYTVKALTANQAQRLYENTRFLSLYANTDFLASYYNNPAAVGSPMPRMTSNLVKVYGDTLGSKLVQANSRPALITSGGDYKAWQKARKMERALEGEFYKMELYNEAQKVAMSGINVGDGWLKLYINDTGDGIECESVFPNEVFVDEVEAAYGKPRKLYQTRYVKKDALRALYLKDGDEAMSRIIDQAQTTNPPRFAWTLYSPGMVEVVEAWSLPYAGQPGRHVIAVSSGTLLDEPWREEYFPFINFKAGDKPFGWYGQGFIEQVGGAQVEMNRTLSVMQEGAQLGITPWWVVQAGSEVNLQHLSNVPGHVVEVNGSEPKWMTSEPFHAAAPAYVEMLKGIISTFYGISDMQSSGEMNLQRLDSRKALAEWQNIADTRHTLLLERWQNFYIHVTERVIMLAKQIAKKRGTYPVMAKKGNKAYTMDWKDLDIERDYYMIRPAAANILPTTIAGKKNDIEDWMRLGLLSKEQAQRALTGPADADAILSEFTASENDIDRLIEQLQEGEYRGPTPKQNLQRALKRVNDAALEAANNGFPQKIINLFDRYLREATALVAKMQPPPAQGMINGSPTPSPGPSAPSPASPAPGSPGASPGASPAPTVGA
jgi:hypothetical protein